MLIVCWHVRHMCSLFMIMLVLLHVGVLGPVIARAGLGALCDRPVAVLPSLGESWL